MLHILNHLNKDELKRIKLVVVLGAPPLKVKDSDPPRYYPRKSHFESSNFGKPEDGIKWDLVYKTNPPGDFKTPNNAGKHMFGPEWLLVTEKCSKTPP